MHHQQCARCRHLRDGREIINCAVRQVGNKRRIHHMLVIQNDQRVAVGRSVLGDLGGVDAGCAGAIIDDGLLLPDLSQPRGKQPREIVGGATRLRGRDGANRAARVVIGGYRRAGGYGAACQGNGTGDVSVD